MAKAKKNSEREHRITEEIIVDAYGPEEKAEGVRMRDVRGMALRSAKVCGRIPGLVAWRVSAIFRMVRCPNLEVEGSRWRMYDDNGKALLHSAAVSWRFRRLRGGCDAGTATAGLCGKQRQAAKA
jgi:hypothetical protein